MMLSLRQKRRIATLRREINRLTQIHIDDPTLPIVIRALRWQIMKLRLLNA